MKGQGANSMSNAAAWREQDGVAVLAMPALEAPGGVRAFFTGRRGGVSPQWQGGLNWSYAVGDEPAHVIENRRRTLSLLGLALSHTVMAGLVHGNRVVAVTGDEAPGPDAVRFVPDCDALITDRPGVALVVTAADCVPVFLYDPVRQAVGAVHAGWRGTVAGVAGRAVAALAEAYGSRPADLLAAVGPSIGPCCYEVDDAVASPLRAYYGDSAAAELLAPGRAPGKYMLDLWAANRRDLHQAGVAQVSVSGECTACGVDRLFSHRAEAGAAGRGAAVIALV
jgi:YfiH family protein